MLTKKKKKTDDSTLEIASECFSGKLVNPGMLYFYTTSPRPNTYVVLKNVSNNPTDTQTTAMSLTQEPSALHLVKFKRNNL